MSPPSFPPSVPRPGSPFPPQGPSGRFPCFVGYYELLGRPAAHCVLLGRLLPLPRFVSFAWGYRLAAETTGSPRFLEDPRIHATLFDPGRIAEPGHSGAALLVGSSMLPSALSKGVGSRQLDSFRSSMTRPACSLSTLRRQGRPLSRRKTRFRLVAHLGRAGLEPAGSLHEVSAVSSTWRPPHPGFAWRTETRV
jgi:hypothetical protein